MKKGDKRTTKKNINNNNVLVKFICPVFWTFATVLSQWNSSTGILKQLNRKFEAKREFQLRALSSHAQGTSRPATRIHLRSFSLNNHWSRSIQVRALSTGLAFMRYFMAFMYTLQLFIPPGCYQRYQTHWQHMDFERRTNWKVISQWWFTAVLQWLSDIPYEKDAKLLGCHRNTGSR